VRGHHDAYTSRNVVRITLSDDDLARTRLAYAPSWEAVASVRLVMESTDVGPTGWYRRWLDAARNALSGVDLQPLAVLIRSPVGYLPDFLLSPPETPSPTFAAELDRLRQTAPERVVAEARLAYPDQTPPALVPYLQRPAEALAVLADVLASYWERSLAPWWPQMRALLEGEMITRGRRLAQGGPDALLADLSPAIRWDAPVLAIADKHCGDQDAAGRGLLLVPLVFGHAARFVSVEGPWRPTVSYSPRGVGLLRSGDGGGVEGEPRLELLLGRGRAAVLTALDEPTSTSALALRLGVSASTVSEHLAVLSRSGVVARRRAGRLVLYTLTPRGRRLVTLFAANEAVADIA
jgi:DNA-binding transcriptional ArsR family regulator